MTPVQARRVWTIVLALEVVAVALLLFSLITGGWNAAAFLLVIIGLAVVLFSLHMRRKST